MKQIYILITLTIMIFSCQETVSDVKKETKTQLTLSFTQLDLDFDSTHFRGLNFINSKDVWITGTDGTYIHYDGVEWKKGQIDSARGLDLRDVHALDNCTAIAITAGSPGKIFKTLNCGESWGEVYTNRDSLIFLDGMDFWKSERGVVFGDPMNGKIKLLYTENSGENWIDFDTVNIPNALTVEAGFAASGTGVIVFDSLIYIGLGGEKSRFMRSENFGESWQLIETPILQGNGSKGIYSMSFKDELNGVAVGGNWESPECDSSKIYTNDGGLTWSLSSGVQHYRSCVTHLKNDIYMSTGTSGTDISYDNGKSWEMIDSLGFNAIQFDAELNKGYAVGSYGKIYQFSIED